LSREEQEKRFDQNHSEEIDVEVLEAVDYIYQGRETEIEIIFPEFTSVCPWTGLPDFGTLSISYIPAQKCVEFKSLKFYLHSYRNVGILQEHAVNRVLDDLTKLLNPISMIVTGEFNPRGGMKTVIKASYPQNSE